MFAWSPFVLSHSRVMIRNRINNIYLELKQRGSSVLDSQERRILVRKVADVMASRMSELDGTDCSRLAWLFMHLRDETRAQEVAHKGYERDPTNEHCLRLIDRFS